MRRYEEDMSREDCIFCRISRGEIEASVLYEDEEMIAFEDVNPQAPVHFLVIPKEHIETLDDLDDRHGEIIGRMLLRAARLARDKGVAESGYRQIINCRQGAGQEVYHLHLHIMGGRPMRKMG